MQIVIDILEQDYERVVHGSRMPIARMRDAIRNGTILPEGHGRLIYTDDTALIDEWIKKRKEESEDKNG